MTILQVFFLVFHKKYVVFFVVLSK
jgi:hypothetical protein